MRSYKKGHVPKMYGWKSQKKYSKVWEYFKTKREAKEYAGSSGIVKKRW